MNTTTRTYKGYKIAHTFPGQWEATVSWDPCINIFPSLKTAKAWIDAQEDDGIVTGRYELTGYDNAYQNPPSYRRVE